MLKTTLTVAAVSLALLLPTSLSAQSVQYLGNHIADPPDDEVNGGQGVLFYNQLCDATFEGAQMCESVDILRSGSLPTSSGPDLDLGWVRPTIVGVAVVSDDVIVTDASGVISTQPGGLSCLGWRLPFGPNTGLTVDSVDGAFGEQFCEVLFKVACCKVTSGKK